MTAREYLHQMKTIKYQIKVQRLELQDLIEDINVLGLSSPFGCPKTPTYEDYIKKAITLTADIKSKTAEKLNYLQEVHARIISLDNELYVSLLIDRYINNRSSEDVSKDINYAPAYVRRLTANAIDCFEKKFGADL